MRARVFLAVVLAGLLVPGIAQAKGPDQATIDGEGMGTPISIEGEEGRQDELATLVELAGLYPALFGQTPDPMLAARPEGPLGPKLVITWRVPDGGPNPSTVEQDLYLYAEGGPVTYTAPGQPVMGGDRSTGGWFRTPPRLVARWDAFDLPSASSLEAVAAPASAGSTDDPSRWPLALAAAVVGLAALAGLGARLTSSRGVRVGST
jgi:hypothetical protein